MDKQKIFILVISFYFLIGTIGNAAKLTFNLKDGAIEIVDKNNQHRQINFDKKKLDNIESFNYKLIFLEKKEADNIYKKKINKLPEKGSKFIKTSSIMEIENKNQFDNYLRNNNFSKIDISEKNLDKLSEQNLEKKNNIYIFKRETNSDFVSDWHYIKKDKNYIIQKTFNIDLKKTKHIFFTQFENSTGLLKTNFVFEIISNGKSYKYVEEFEFDLANSLVQYDINGNRLFYGFYPLEYKTRIKDNINVEKFILKEVVIHFDIKNSANIRTLKHQIFKINKDNFFINFPQSQEIIVPGKSLENFINILSKNRLMLDSIYNYRINMLREEQSEFLTYPVITEHFWKSSLFDLYNILSNDPDNASIYIDNLSEKNKKVFDNSKKNTFFNILALNNFILKTILFSLFLVFICSLKSKLSKKFTKSLISTNIILLFSIFALSLFFGLTGFLPILTLNLFLGLIIFANFYLILIGKNSGQN